MPKSLRVLYDQAQPAPALHLLNPYRYDRNRARASLQSFLVLSFSDDGRDSTKFYTDPSFFFNLWMQSMISLPNQHPVTRSGKHERVRSPVRDSHTCRRASLDDAFAFRKDKSRIIKNRSTRRIQSRRLNLVSFDKSRTSNRTAVLRNSFIIGQNTAKSCAAIIDLTNRSTHPLVIASCSNIPIVITNKIRI